VQTRRLTILLCLVTPVAACAASFVVTSSEFSDNGPAPRAGAQPQSGGGSSSSPALAWTGAPAATKSYAIVVTDVDAWGPAGFLTHWIAYGIPGLNDVQLLPGGIRR
jgi:phosphatidylethanolamine-binding protein (PEBP) family uncharacterized protein